MTTTTAKRSTRVTSDALRLERGETVHGGVDVPKRAYHVAVLSDRRGYLTTWGQPADPGLLCDRLRSARGQVAQIVSEAGPTGFTLARERRKAGRTAEVIAPSTVPALAGAAPKSDRRDCRRLARSAQKGLLTAVRVPTAEEEADRQGVRLREQLGRKLPTAQQRNWPRPRDTANRWPRCGRSGGGPGHRDDLPHGAARAGAVHRRRPGGPDGRAGPTGPSERPDPPGGAAAEVGQRPAADGAGGGGLAGVAGDEAAGRRYRQLVAATGSGKKAIVGMARRRAVLLWRLSVRCEPYRAAA